MNNINLQWKSQQSDRPIKQYSFIITGIIKYESVPLEHLT